MYEKEEHMDPRKTLRPEELAACLWLLGLTLLAGGERRSRA